MPAILKERMIGVDEKSKKKLIFLKNTYELLNIQSTDFNNNIETYIEEQLKFFSGEIPNNLSAKKALSNAEYMLKTIKSSASCMNDLFNEIKYTEEDLQHKKMSLLKNAYISECSMITSIKADTDIPNFYIGIINLGIDGIRADDELVVTLEYADVIGEQKTINIGTDLINLGETIRIGINNMHAPRFAYQYKLYVELKNGGVSYYKDFIKIINIIN